MDRNWVKFTAAKAENKFKDFLISITVITGQPRVKVSRTFICIQTRYFVLHSAVFNLGKNGKLGDKE
jgi:hypothetical protein